MAIKSKILLSVLALSLVTTFTTKVSAQNVNEDTMIYSINTQTNQNDITRKNIIMLDVARRKMNEQQIIQCIKNVDPHKFQFVQLHLSDNENYAIKSNILHNTNNDNTLSLTSLQNIVRFANKRGITIIPDIDVPSHAKGIIDDLKQCNSSWLKYDIVMDSETLDYTNPETVNFVKQLYAEVLPVFQNQKYKYFVIGGDEVPGNGNCAMQFSDFINKLNQYLNRKGFSSIVWNDSINRTALNNLDKNITIDYWIKSDANTNVKDFINHGNPVKNANHQNSYYNTIDLNDYGLRREKAANLANQNTSKMLCLWGSDDFKEQNISNKKVISYIDQVENLM